jgi:hypothetical protein
MRRKVENCLRIHAFLASRPSRFAFGGTMMREEETHRIGDGVVFWARGFVTNCGLVGKGLGKVGRGFYASSGLFHVVDLTVRCGREGVRRDMVDIYLEDSGSGIGERIPSTLFICVLPVDRLRTTRKVVSDLSCSIESHVHTPSTLG